MLGCLHPLHLAISYLLPLFQFTLDLGWVIDLTVQPLPIQARTKLSHSLLVGLDILPPFRLALSRTTLFPDDVQAELEVGQTWYWYEAMSTGYYHALT